MNGSAFPSEAGVPGGAPSTAGETPALPFLFPTLLVTSATSR
jgi:hypothetical protein